MHMQLVKSDDRRDPPRYEPVTDEQWEIRAVQEGLYAACQKYGGPRVMTWLKTMAAIAGQGVE